MGAIDLLNRDMKILIQESYRRGAEITQRNTNFASAMQICDFLFSWRDFITTKVTPSWSTATSVIQNSKFVIQNFPACGSAALGSSASSTLSGLCGKKFFHENNLKWRPADYLLLKHDADIEHHIVSGSAPAVNRGRIIVP